MGPEPPVEVDVARLVDQWKPELQKYLDEKGAISGGERIGELIEQLMIELCDLLWIPTPVERNLTYLKYLLRAMRGGTIVTLNIDNALEMANTHPVPERIAGGLTPLSTEFNDTPEETIRLIRLHGSLGWQYDQSNGVVHVVGSNELPSRVKVWRQGVMPPYPPAVIFGAGNKLRADGPFLELFMEFKNALQRASRLVVVGYGWRDPHVNELIRRWLEHGRRERLFRITRMDGSDEDGLLELTRSIALAGMNGCEFQHEFGPAAANIGEIMRPEPGLTR
jgi:hypothetical protein